MKLNPPANQNYAATIVRVRSIVQLPNCDNVVGVPMFGFQAITSKDIQVDDLRVLFTAETQLSPGYASQNNLHRHSNLNVNPDAKGYLEDNRRVKALKFRGNTSNALLMPLESLAYTGVDVADLNEGDTFDELNGYEVCQKYVVRRPRGRGELGVGQGRRRIEPRVDERLFPKHFDTANYFRMSEQISIFDNVIVTQKLHGTSVRFGHTVVKRKLSWLERIAKRLGVAVQETEYAYVYGSRNVVKDPDNPFASPGFYATDIYSGVGQRFKGAIPKGYLVYGEIVGWVGDTPIQRDFTYQIPRGVAKLYVYRVVHVNPDGRAVDLTWERVRDFCLEIGADHVPELYRGTGMDEGVVSTFFIDRRFADDHSAALPTDDTVDEGVCIRKEAGFTPLVLKAKSPKFLEHETKLLDIGVTDIESVESVESVAPELELVG